MVRSALFTTMLALALAAVPPATASAGAMNQCHQVAAECMKQGGDRISCQARVDECKSRNACEEVYLSCLELMEIDETITEEACSEKRRQCALKRSP